jgi:uncharacterized integral membrane protein
VTNPKDAGTNPAGEGGKAGSPHAEVYGQPRPASSMTKYIRPTLWGLLIVYALAVLLANRDSVEVNFIFFTARAPLVIALGVMFVVGALVGIGALMMRDRRKGKAKG